MPEPGTIVVMVTSNSLGSSLVFKQPWSFCGGTRRVFLCGSLDINSSIVMVFCVLVFWSLSHPHM